MWGTIVSMFARPTPALSPPPVPAPRPEVAAARKATVCAIVKGDQQIADTEALVADLARLDLIDATIYNRLRDPTDGDA